MRFFISVHVWRLAITRFQEIGSKFGILWVAGADLVEIRWRDENRMGFQFLFPRRIRTFAAGMSSSLRIQLLSLKKQNDEPTKQAATGEWRNINDQKRKRNDITVLLCEASTKRISSNHRKYDE